MLQELVDRVTGGDTVTKAARDALAPLKLLGTGVYGDAVGYVLEGSTPEVLMSVQQPAAADLDSLFGAPLKLWSGWVSPDVVKRVGAVHKGWNIESGVAARGRLYASADPAVLARLGRLLAQVCETSEVPAVVPEWFYVLVYDGARRGTTDRHRSGRPVAGVADRLIPAFLERVAVDGGIPDTDATSAVLTAILHRGSSDRSWYRDPREAMAKRPEFDQYVTQHVGTLAGVVAQLGAHGKQELLARIGTRTGEAGLVEIVATLAVDKAKGVRTSALSHLAALDDTVQLALLAPHLTTVPTGRLDELVTRVAALAGGIDALAEALAAVRDEHGKVRAGQSARVRLLEQTVERSRALTSSPSDDGSDTAAEIEVPGYEPLPDPVVEPGWPAHARKVLDEQVAKARVQLDIARHGGDANKYWAERAQRTLNDLLSITDDDLATVPDRVTGAVVTTGKTRRRQAVLLQWLTAELRDLFPEPGLVLVVRIHALRDGHAQRNFLWALRPYLDQVTDLRQVRDALVRAQVPKVDEQICDLVFQTWWGGDALPPSVAWPYFAERPEILDRYLGQEEKYRHGTGTVLRILRELPVVPANLLPRLTTLALGTGKTHRLAAQEVLEAHTGARRLAEQALADAKAEVRASAAAWLARIGDPAAVPALRTALKKERREAARAALLSTLEALGDDISADLAPAILEAEAAKGLAAKLPASLGWFPFEQLPAVRWAVGTAAGQTVPRDVVRWWVVLATKLKSPSGEGLVARYVGLLDEASRAALGSFVLRAWVAQDTRNPSVESSRAHADQHAQQRWTSLQDSIKRYPEYYGNQAGQTVEDIWKSLYRQDQATYLGSATQEKGLLALTAGMPGAELAATAQHYFAAHKGRRAQAEYLVRALAANGDRAAVQLLLAVSRRFKQRSVQETASALAQDIADRNGWDADQLADRTVQTAGFDDDGILRLDLGAPYGERVVTGRITEAFTLELRNPAGKVVKALPAQRASDDAEAYADAKRQLKESRAELRAVVTLQTQRFGEAMVTGRTWTFADWREFVLGHPLMSRLAARLVWAAELPGGGAAVTFRPGDGGVLIGVDDEDVTLPGDARVSVVHAVTLGADGAPAWRSHLADYEITPLLDQGLGADAPAVSELLPDVPDSADVITVREGWLSDSFTIRGRATKLGYARSQAEDAGWFNAYCREYPALGLTVEIEFTGAFLPEENITAAVRELVFRRTGTWGERGRLAIKDVPKALLAVSYRDYLTVADGGVFDPDWEKKSQY